MTKEYRDYLRDIFDSILSIENFVDGMTIQEFLTDLKTQFAVVRAFEIIGEAASKISNEIKEKYQDLPWREMVTMRNKLIHEYSGVSNAVIWQTIQQDLPSLKKGLEEILKMLNV